MQDTTQEPGPGRRQFLKPWRAFIATLLVVALSFGLWLAADTTRNEDLPTHPAAAPAQMSEAEAKEVFTRLHKQLMKAYAKRDVTLIPRLFTAASPMRDRVLQEFRQLQAEGLRLVADSERLHVDVFSIRPDSISLRETLISDAHLLDQDGRNVTANRSPQRQEIVWELQATSDEWLLHDSEIVTAKEVGRPR